MIAKNHRLLIGAMIALAGSLAITAACLELGTRALRRSIVFDHPFEADSHEMYDAHLHHVMIPRSNFVYTSPEGDLVPVRINADGLRSPYETSQNADIAVLADSFGIGLQVAEHQTFPSVMESHLNAQLGKSIRVVNGGVGGYDPAQYYLSYLYLLHKYHPRVVVVNIFLGNDLEDDSLGSHPKSVWPHHSHSGLHLFTNWLFDNSYFVQFVHARWERLKHSSKLATPSVPETLPQNSSTTVTPSLSQKVSLVEQFMNQSRGAVISPAILDGIKRQYDTELDFLGPEGQDGLPQGAMARRAIEVAIQRLTEIREATQKDGVPYLLVSLVPSRLMADPHASREALYLADAHLLSKRATVTGSLFADHLRQVLEGRGFTVVNILHEIENAKAEPKKLYWKTDGHFNAIGYELLGKAIANRILLEGWFTG